MPCLIPRDSTQQVASIRGIEGETEAYRNGIGPGPKSWNCDLPSLAELQFGDDLEKGESRVRCGIKKGRYGGTRNIVTMGKEHSSRVK